MGLFPHGDCNKWGYAPIEILKTLDGTQKGGPGLLNFLMGQKS